LCGLPIAHVAETLRPLPQKPVKSEVAAVSGVAIVRGEPTVIVDVARLFGLEASGPAQRFVRLRDGRVALHVDHVLGISVLNAHADMPSLLSVALTDGVAALTRADRELFVVLDSGRLLAHGEGAEA
jgi:purine-binding chemotaxis protein CheW